jgi:uncharacterized protein
MSEQPADGDVVVRPNDAELRYELVVDGQLAGFARYVRRGGRMIFVHTEVDPAYGGRGLGTVLARGALDAARAEGVPVVPLCPFIAAFIERNTEYQDIVDVETLEYLERR